TPRSRRSRRSATGTLSPARRRTTRASAVARVPPELRTAAAWACLEPVGVTPRTILSGEYSGPSPAHAGVATRPVTHANARTASDHRISARRPPRKWRRNADRLFGVGGIVGRERGPRARTHCRRMGSGLGERSVLPTRRLLHAAGAARGRARAGA